MANVPEVPPEQAGQQRKPFAAFMQEHRGGGLHSELSDLLAELVLATRELGKKGSLTLKLDVAPNADGQTVTIVDAITLKKPEASRPAGIWYSDEEGNLSRRNPMQQELPIREVPDARRDAQ